jgi:hypothetical protein
VVRLVDRGGLAGSYIGKLGDYVGNGLIKPRFRGVKHAPHIVAEACDPLVTVAEDQKGPVEIGNVGVGNFIFSHGSNAFHSR